MINLNSYQKSMEVRSFLLQNFKKLINMNETPHLHQNLENSEVIASEITSKSRRRGIYCESVAISCNPDKLEILEHLLLNSQKLQLKFSFQNIMSDHGHTKLLYKHKAVEHWD